MVIASAVFGLTTLLACLASKQLMSFWRSGWWDRPETNYVVVGLPVLATVFANIAFLRFGASGAFGANAKTDLKDLFVRLLARHLLYGAGFLAPQVAMARSQSLNPILVVISLLFLYPMIAIYMHVSSAIVERVKHENLGRFLGGVGEPKAQKSRKGVRRK